MKRASSLLSCFVVAAFACVGAAACTQSDSELVGESNQELGQSVEVWPRPGPTLAGPIGARSILARS